MSTSRRGSKNDEMDDVSDWLNGLPASLGPQRRLLEGLLSWCERDEDARWLTVGCSLERGNADPLSDIDVAMGVNEEQFEEVLARVRGLVGRLGDLVESFDYSPQFWVPLRHFFAQYRDRTQIDLMVTCAPTSAIPRVLVLYDPEGAVTAVGDEALEPKPDEVRLWACQAWVALANVGKYLRRSSPWEALRELDQARTNLFQLWALAEGLPQARYGPTAILDADGARMPLGIDKSLAGAVTGELLTAAQFTAKMLSDLQQRLDLRRPLSDVAAYQLPFALGEFVVADLDALSPRPLR